MKPARGGIVYLQMQPFAVTAQHWKPAQRVGLFGLRIRTSTCTWILEALSVG